MDIISQIFFAYGGMYRIAFLVLLLIFLILFLKTIFEKQFLNAFIIMLFMFPILGKAPNFSGFCANIPGHIRRIEGIGIVDIFVLFFLWIIHYENDYKNIIKFLKKNKILLFIIVASLSMAISQQLSLPSKIGFLYGFTKVLRPFIFMIIVAYIFCKYSKKLTIIVNWIIASILFSSLFSFLITEQTIRQEGFVRFGEGSMGSTTMAAAITFTWALIGILNFINNNQRFLNIFDKRQSFLNMNKLFSIIGLGSLIFIGISTHTRGPLIYFIFGFVLLMIIAGLKKALSFCIPFIIVAIFILVPFRYNIINEMQKREIPSFDKIQYDENWVARIKRNNAALILLKKNPIIGIGMGNPSSGSGFPGNVFYEAHFHIYNTPLAWATYGGLFCGLAFLAINIQVFLLALLNIIRKRNYKHRLFIIGLALVLLCWFIDFFTTANNLLFLYPFTAVIYYYAILGGIIGLIVKDLEDKEFC